MLVAVVQVASISDSKGNTWTALNNVVGNFGSNTTIYYAENPTVGTGHTFTSGAFGSLCVSAFSGAALSSVFDQQTAGGSAAGGAGTTVQPGSVTPTQDDELIISGVGGNQYANPPTVDSGFTIPANQPTVDGVNFGSTIGYLIQTSASAVNPTWTVDGHGLTVTCNIATFKAAAGGGGGKPWYAYAQQRIQTTIERRWERRGTLWTPSYALRKAA